MADILIIFGLILLNGVFSMSELAVVSAKRLRLEKRSEDGSRGARVALQLADNPSIFLSTVQVGITLISIFNGAFGEASLVAKLTPHIAGIPGLAGSARDIALAVVVVGITFASIIFGELVPKRIAIQHPETMATLIAVPLQWLSRLMGPFVKILSMTTEFVMRVLGMRQPADDSPTEEEVTGMLRASTDAGVFEKTEFDLATRALHLDDQRLRALMTPRIDLDFIDLNDDADKNLLKIANSPYSRFPVLSKDHARVLGVVHAGDLFEQAIRNHSITGIDIAAVIKPPLYVPESVSALALLELFKKNRVELALVVDEYGEIEGMITLSDIMGALVGDVPAVDASREVDAVQRDDGSWFVDGGISLDRFRDVLGSDTVFPQESSGAYHTLAGFVLAELGRIPQPSDHFKWNGYRFEVVDMDGNRIDRLLVAKGERSATPDTGARAS